MGCNGICWFCWWFWWLCHLLKPRKLEGNFRGKHSELITNCEQIAFLGGERPEKDVLNISFAELMTHCRRTINASFNSEVLRQYLNKYFCTVIGLVLIARPLRFRAPEMGELRNDQIAQYFTSTWRNMEAMATAIQDLFELTNRIGRLSGFATRVRELMVGLQVRPPVLAEEIDAAKQGVVHSQSSCWIFWLVVKIRHD